MSKTNYTKKYGGDQWERLRKTVITMQDSECPVCGEKKLEGDLQVHHITPYDEFDDKDQAHNLSNLVALCARHHGQAEKGSIDITNYI